MNIRKFTKRRGAVLRMAAGAGLFLCFGTAYASNICPTASLSTYINGTNSPCMIGSDTFTFGPTLSYAGLSLGVATPPMPSQITVVPGGGNGNPSLSFTGNFAVDPVSDGGLSDSFAIGGSPVPEPASIGLCGAAMRLAGLLRLKRAKTRQGDRNQFIG